MELKTVLSVNVFQDIRGLLIVIKSYVPWFLNKVVWFLDCCMLLLLANLVFVLLVLKCKPFGIFVGTPSKPFGLTVSTPCKPCGLFVGIPCKPCGLFVGFPCKPCGLFVGFPCKPFRLFVGTPCKPFGLTVDTSCKPFGLFVGIPCKPFGLIMGNPGKLNFKTNCFTGFMTLGTNNGYFSQPGLIYL